jgi:hypothetical protein
MGKMQVQILFGPLYIYEDIKYNKKKKGKILEKILILKNGKEVA